jgi:hypothetical protein
MSVLAAGPVDCQADRDLWHEYQSGSGAATGVGEVRWGEASKMIRRWEAPMVGRAAHILDYMTFPDLLFLGS